MSDPTDIRRGSCRCGAVRFTTSGAPVMAGNCYCRDCQKSSGAGHVFHAMFPEAAVDIAGETRGFPYTADSGSVVTTVVCATCGSPLFGRTSRMPGMMTVRVAAFDSDDGLAPSMEVYVKRRRAWDGEAKDVPRFEGMPPM
jgi:hypothetical protein